MPHAAGAELGALLFHRGSAQLKKEEKKKRALQTFVISALLQGGDGGQLPGLVDFDTGVPPSCQTDQPILPNFHLLEQYRADSGMSKLIVNPTKKITDRTTLYM